ncbi:MAG TPA: sensor domain-containing diguanylate cyclase [Microthrixaceae bacterium]|nr:sensor domain-containing diguanylate cyclase [Microthrixaceae bacterium]
MFDNGQLPARFFTDLLEQLGPLVVMSSVRDEAGVIVDFRYEVVNSAFCAIVQESPEVLLGSRLLDLYPSHVELGLFDEYRRVVETGEPFVSELPWFDERNVNAFLEVRATKFQDGYLVTGRDLTEAKLAATLREVFDFSRDAIISVDPDRRVQAWNAGAERLYGFAESDAVGRRLGDLDAAGPLVETLAAFDAGLAGNEPEPIQVTVSDDAGVLRRVEVVVTPILGVDGSVIGASSIHRSLTDTAVRTAGSKPGQDLFDIVLAGVSDLIVVVDDQMKFSFVNEAARRILGHDPDQWLGRDAFELIHPDDIGLAIESLTNTLDSGEGVKEPLLLRLRHADGSWRQLEIIANNLLGASHVSGLVITARDVSERLTAEATAHEARDRFEQAFDRAPVGMALVATDGRLLRVNAAFAAMVREPLRTLTGRNLLDLAHPDDRERAAEHAAAVVELGDDTPIEVRFFRNDHTVAWARVTSTVIRNADGQAMHVVTHLEDVTEQRSLRDELHAAATHDPLTGLLNRTGFEASFRATQPTGSSALFVIDLDRFKPVNDAHGHLAGDRLLQLVASRLRSCLRRDEVAARLGGDEFGVFVPDILDAANAIALGERIRTVLDAPFDLDEGTVHISGSVGVALLHGNVALGIALATADRASYEAKRNGGNDVEFGWCTVN